MSVEVFPLVRKDVNYPLNDAATPGGTGGGGNDLEQRLSSIETRLDNVETRLNRVENAVVSIDARTARMEVHGATKADLTHAQYDILKWMIGTMVACAGIIVSAMAVLMP